ncbi:MAG: host attachment protein [Nitrospirota bacterium]|nr:host attachment protein [Nitrospirota bacterium]
MAVTWVLVADSSRARIFSKNGSGGYREVAGFIHPESRMHDQQLTSDLPGTAAGHAGSERHALGEKTPPKRHEAVTFSKQVTSHLEHARTSRAFDKLAVIAPPSFLGMLREQYSQPLAGMVKQEVTKNIVQLAPRELMPHLPSRL